MNSFTRKLSDVSYDIGSMFFKRSLPASPNSDYVWLTPFSQQFLEKGYLIEGQTVDQRINIICERAEQILKRPGFAKAFKANIQKGWYSLSSPIWTNFGTDRGLPISCFGSHIEDTMESILSTQAEVGMMTKNGGGTSAFFGKIRSRGSKIKNNGESHGSVHFMQLFENMINVVSQGSTRRGQFAPYMPIDHKDILEFLKIRTEGSPLQNVSTGVTISDAWFQSMIDGDMEKRAIWAKVLEARTNTGYPYLFFTDNANNNTVDVYKDLLMTIDHSNLCVTGDQLVVTNNGIQSVLDLYKQNENLVLFDGEKPVNASSMKLIESNAAVFEVITESGRSHKITDYHKLKTDHGMIALKDLRIGDKVCIQKNKGLFGNKHNPELAFLLGLYQADGTQTEKTIFIDLWENDFDLINEIESFIAKIYRENNWETYDVNVPNKGIHSRPSIIPTFGDCTPTEGNVLKKRLQSCKLKQFGFLKGNVPNWVWQSDEETQWQYLRGLYYADGSVTLSESNGNPVSLYLGSVDKKFLQQIQILLSNLGISTSIHILHESGEHLLPDGKGGHKYYECQTMWRLVCSNKPNALIFNKMTGFLDRKGIALEDRDYRDNTKKFDTIKEIRFVGWEDVYCIKVDSPEHIWVCNSFVTSNCTEIMLPDCGLESFVCDLSSMNIIYFDQWKDTDAVELLVYFLDAVMTEFIQKARKIKFMERTVRFAERHRALGIGWFGWHSYLQSKMVPFESLEAKMLNVKVAKTIKEQSYSASAKMAKRYGEPEILKGYGRRNTTLMAIAPTKSSAFIIGQASESIQPELSNYCIEDLQKGKYTSKNKYLEDLLIAKGMNTIEVWDSILKNAGSVQHLDFLTQIEKDVFKTFGEISPKETIIQAAQRQKYIDQGQSLNLMIHPSIPIKDVNALIIEAWKLGIKSLYYQINVNAAQQFTRNVLTCTSCEG